MMDFKRRDFLERSGASVLAAATMGGPWELFAASAGTKPCRQAERAARTGNPVLVVVFLRGGSDQLNTFIPYNDATYYRIRPEIAIPKEAVIQLDDRWGLHPAMGPLKAYYEQGRFAAVINSGLPRPIRSRFEAQDFMEYAGPRNRRSHGGWLNRYLIATENPRGEGPSKLRALAMQERLPRSLRGKYPVVSVPPNLEHIDGVLDVFESFYREKNGADSVKASGMQAIRHLRRLRKVLYETDRAVKQPVVGDGTGLWWFASRMTQLAKVIKADIGLTVAASDINGWNHRIGMGSTDGKFSRLLGLLANGLAAFLKELGRDLGRTVILVQTEFGRACHENGVGGTDEGYGCATWLLGDDVRGGRIYGKWTGLDPESLHAKRDLPATTDFRDILAEVLRKHMKFTIPADFFPGYILREKGLGLFG